MKKTVLLIVAMLGIAISTVFAQRNNKTPVTATFATPDNKIIIHVWKEALMNVDSHHPQLMLRWAIDTAVLKARKTWKKLYGFPIITVQSPNAKEQVLSVKDKKHLFGLFGGKGPEDGSVYLDFYKDKLDETTPFTVTVSFPKSPQGPQLVLPQQQFTIELKNREIIPYGVPQAGNAIAKN